MLSAVSVKTPDPAAMKQARPTLRALTVDMHLPVPEVDIPLDALEHPLLAKASEQFVDGGGRHERIRAVADQVLFKVKVQRWRGAVWVDGDQPWVVAAGHREDGSGDDFYTALEADARAARARYNAEHAPPLTTPTYVGHLLPGEQDRIRYLAEAGARFNRFLRETVLRLVRASLRDGREHRHEFDSFGLGIQVRADDGHETYVAVRVTGSVQDDVVFVILELVPGCDRDGWGPEFVLPDRLLSGKEQAWSTLMDPQAAAKLLDDEGPE